MDSKDFIIPGIMADNILRDKARRDLRAKITELDYKAKLEREKEERLERKRKAEEEREQFIENAHANGMTETEFRNYIAEKQRIAEYRQKRWIAQCDEARRKANSNKLMPGMTNSNEEFYRIIALIIMVIIFGGTAIAASYAAH